MRFSTSLTILMYHKVDRIPPGAKHVGNYVLPEAFESQLAALKRWSYQSIDFDAWLAFRNRSGTLPERPLIITFDDGYRSTYDNAWPILRRAGFSATVFLVSDLIGQTNAWDAGEIQEPLLNDSEIREMHNGGITFGSHTKSHPAMTKISTTQAGLELNESRRSLEKLLGSPVKHFCYPYAKQNPEVRALVRAAGYKSAVIGRGGLNRSWTDPYMLRRIKVDTRTTIPRLRFSLLKGKLGI